MIFPCPKNPSVYYEFMKHIDWLLVYSEVLKLDLIFSPQVWKSGSEEEEEKKKKTPSSVAGACCELCGPSMDSPKVER